MSKILILSPYPEGEAAGQRLKYEQYYASWKKQGYELHKSSFFDQNTWDILWKKGFLLKKIIGNYKFIHLEQNLDKLYNKYKFHEKY